jgi:hypothetical protein
MHLILMSVVVIELLVGLFMVGLEVRISDSKAHYFLFRVHLGSASASCTISTLPRTFNATTGGALGGRREFGAEI